MVSYVIHAAILTVGITIALVLWSYLKKRAAENLVRNAEQKAKQLADDAARQAETLKREANLEAKDKFYNLKNDLEKQIRDKRQEMQSLERRLNQKEENLERKIQYLETRERELTARDRAMEARDRELQEAQKRADQLIVEQKRQLEKMAGMTADEARRTLIRSIEGEARQEAVGKHVAGRLVAPRVWTSGTRRTPCGPSVMTISGTPSRWIGRVAQALAPVHRAAFSSSVICSTMA